jgi:hypothetical protein
MALPHHDFSEPHKFMVTDSCKMLCKFINTEDNYCILHKLTVVQIVKNTQFGMSICTHLS